MKKSFFITGTGTGIGKTVVTCALVKQLREQGRDVLAIKPVISGWEDSAENDTLQILSSIGLPYSQENIEKISPWRFAAPLAPSMAARIEGKKIDYKAIVDFCKTSANAHEYLLCEGAGGVAVPLNNTKTTLDLMCDLQFPVILVCGTYLGAISHALTAIKTLESAGISIHTIIVNESENGVSLADTVLELKNFIDYPIIPIARVATDGGFVWERVSLKNVIPRIFTQ